MKKLRSKALFFPFYQNFKFLFQNLLKNLLFYFFRNRRVKTAFILYFVLFNNAKQNIIKKCTKRVLSSIYSYSKIKINPRKILNYKKNPSYISWVSGITNYSTGPVKKDVLDKMNFLLTDFFRKQKKRFSCNLYFIFFSTLI